MNKRLMLLLLLRVDAADDDDDGLVDVLRLHSNCVVEHEEDTEKALAHKTDDDRGPAARVSPSNRMSDIFFMMETWPSFNGRKKAKGVGITFAVLVMTGGERLYREEAATRETSTKMILDLREQ